MKADEVIEVPEVPDYSDSQPHEQTVLVRADSLAQGDFIVIPYSGSHYENPALGVRGKTFELYSSTTCLRSPGWVLIAFGVEMMRWRTAPADLWHKRVPHNPPTCGYCLARFEAARADAGLTYSSAKGTVEAHSTERGSLT